MGSGGTYDVHPQMNLIRLISILGAAGLVTAAPIYTLADLGTLGGPAAMATSVNDQGQAVGTMLDAYGYMHAFSLFRRSDRTRPRRKHPALTMRGRFRGRSFSMATRTPLCGTTVWRPRLAALVPLRWPSTTPGDVAGMLVNNGHGNAFVTENGTIIDLGGLREAPGRRPML